MPMAHAAAWYSDAMRLWKRGPAIFTALALVMLACNLAMNLVPVAGVAIAQILLPLLECGLLYASLAADRGDAPRIRRDGIAQIVIGRPCRRERAPRASHATGARRRSGAGTSV